MIVNCTWNDYLLIEDKTEINIAIKYGIQFRIQENHFKFKSLMQCEFGIVKDLQYDWSVGFDFEKIFEYFIAISGKPYEWFENQKLLHIFQQKNWLLNEIEQITIIESKALSAELTTKEATVNENAGAKNFEKFGVYPQILEVANGNPLEIERARKLKYEDAFLYLCYKKTLNEFEKKRVEIWQSMNK